MSLAVTSLASGSSGNALLARYGETALLIDCGIALRTLEALLRYQGLAPSQIRALALTHEHHDHALSAAALARRYGVPLICNQATHDALGTELAGLNVELLPVGERATLGPFDLSSFRVAHDAADPVGYRIRAGDAAVAVAIDLGSWDAATVTALHGADLLVVEANHDRELLRSGPYPRALQQRILGNRGHLDNVQCGELLARSCAGPCVAWLAHLSAQSNSPRIAVASVGRVLSLAGLRGIELGVLPRRSSRGPAGAPTWRSDDRRLVQTSLFEL